MTGQPEAAASEACAESAPADGIMVSCELAGDHEWHRGMYVRAFAGTGMDVEVTWLAGEPADRDGETVASDDLPAVLSAVALRSYMRATGWTEGFHGSHGSVFTRDGFKVCVPLEDDDPDATRCALYRLAVAEKREAAETEAAVWAHRDARGAVADAAGPVPDDSGRALPARHTKAQGRTVTVTDQDVAAALLADVQFHKAARSLVWTSPSSEAVRAMLEAVAPRLVAAEQARAEAAGARLAEVRAVLLEGGQGDATARRRAMAIVGTGEEGRG